jgi:hypothetical protein
VRRWPGYRPADAAWIRDLRRICTSFENRRRLRVAVARSAPQRWTQHRHVIDEFENPDSLSQRPDRSLVTSPAGVTEPRQRSADTTPTDR